MNNDLQNMMKQALQLTRAGQLGDATRAIQRALGGTFSAAMSPAPAAPVNTARLSPLAEASGTVLDGCVFEVEPAGEGEIENTGEAETAKAHTHAAEFITGTHTHATLKRNYKLYLPNTVPTHASPKPLPLVVMLHGCTQTPDDFAAGTGMNEHALKDGFYVLYPEQSAGANPQRCWNWFKHNHQSRGKGEAALLASMTQDVVKTYAIDPRRIYIAGLSAGGAMAAIVAAAYPDIFAAVGVHSGLAPGAAANVSQALSAMRGGASLSAPGVHTQAGTSVPTIVFHGDQDRTVHPRNGEQVISALQGLVNTRVEQGTSAQGRRYTRSISQGELGRELAEHWLVHGAGHAWSGGNVAGSYTDQKGPDATREMLRFFFAHSL